MAIPAESPAAITALVTSRRAPLTPAAMIVFSTLNLPLAALAIAVSAYVPAYFASHLSMSLTAVGATFGLVRAIDIPVDPLLGIAMDRTLNRLGRYRVWVLAGAPVLMLSLSMLFMAPPVVPQGYLLFWLLLMYFGLSILQLAHAAWASSLATTYDARARLFGIMGAVGVAGATAVLIIPVVYDAIGRSSNDAVKAMIWTIIAMIPAASGLVILSTREHVSRDFTRRHGFNFKAYVALVTHPSMARILAADLLFSLGVGWMGASTVFFFRFGKGFTTGQFSLLLIVYLVSGVVGAPLMARIAVRLSKHRAAMLASGIYCCAYMILGLAPRQNFWVSAAGMTVAGITGAGFNALTRAMIADVSDEIRLDQGKDRAGLLYALITTTSKISSAVAIALTFFVLDWIGFSARDGAANTKSAIQGMELSLVVTPIAFCILATFCLMGYALGPERLREIQRRLAEREAQFTASPNSSVS